MFFEISALKLQINLLHKCFNVCKIFIKTTRKTPTCEKEKKEGKSGHGQAKKNCILYTYRIWSACKWKISRIMKSLIYTQKYCSNVVI